MYVPPSNQGLRLIRGANPPPFVTLKNVFVTYHGRVVKGSAGDAGNRIVGQHFRGSVAVAFHRACGRIRFCGAAGARRTVVLQQFAFSIATGFVLGEKNSRRTVSENEAFVSPVSKPTDEYTQPRTNRRRREAKHAHAHVDRAGTVDASGLSRRGVGGGGGSGVVGGAGDADGDRTSGRSLSRRRANGRDTPIVSRTRSPLRRGPHQPGRRLTAIK